MWKTGLVPGLPFALAQRSGPNCGLRQQRPSEATCGLPQRWFRAPQVFASGGETYVTGVLLRGRRKRRFEAHFKRLFRGSEGV